MKRIFLVVAAIATVQLAQVPVSSQTGLRKQLNDGAALQPLSQGELDQLGDPLFRLVLREHSQEVRLDEIDKLIMGEKGQRNLFIVDEQLQDPTRGHSRRAVSMFRGTNQDVRLDPNIALSTMFDDRGFIPGFVEAWGWDDARSRYNYYKVEGTPPTWRFRGSSVGAAELAPSQRRGTCMVCHVNGGPVMKELPFPWNNWHSFRNLVKYLDPTAAGHWEVANSPRFRDLRGAEGLETGFILPAIRQFNARRIAERVASVGPADQEVSDGPALLRPLFATTEYNIISSGQFSGLHPIPSAGGGPQEPVVVPDTFFLNANLLAGGGIPQYEGLGVPEARQFGSVLQIQPAEYLAVVTKFDTSIGAQRGDTNFAWFVPEASHIDNHMIDLLVKKGIVTREFAAAVMTVDVERPVFSSARQRLSVLVPKTFRFRAIGAGEVPAAHPDQLTRAVILNLKALNAAAGSPEAEFLAALENPNPIDVLRGKVGAYSGRVRSALSDPQRRQAEIERLYRAMADRRREAAAHNPTLVESQLLFPNIKQ